MFFREPYAVSRTDLPTIDLTQTTSVFDIGPEFDAIGHWTFGTENPTFADLIGGRTLTQQGAAPVLSAGFATINGSPGNALLTPFADAAVQTICMVARMPPTVQSAILAGTLTATAADGGSAIFLNNSASTLTATVRQIAGGLGAAKTGAAGNWIFVALSESLGANPGSRLLRIGGGTTNPAATSDTTIKTLAAAAKRVAVGNAYYAASGFTGDVVVSEFIVFPGFKSAADLDAIYARSQVRCGGRGITVL